MCLHLPMSSNRGQLQPAKLLGSASPYLPAGGQRRAYRAGLDSAAYGQSFRQRETREKFLQNTVEQSVIQTEIPPGIRDRILTLSTCSGMGHETRWVVQARLNMVLRKEGLPQNDLQKT